MAANKRTALATQSIEPSGDDHNWRIRSELWSRRSTKIANQRAKRERPRVPLVLCGHGVSLRLENGSLTIRNGFTHYPQIQETYRFFKGELAIPERIILLEGSGSISFDVLSWLAEQDVSMVRIDWRGEVVCVASRSGYAANPYRVQWQREMRADENQRMEFSISKIAQKIENSISTLEKVVRRNEAWNKAMEIAYSTLTQLDERRPKTISQLRALEANAAAAYFRAWKGIPIKWRGIGKRPIPDAWKEIQQRTSIFHRAGNCNASHPVNAILNYAYTVLQSEIQISAISEGYDPTIGIMHEGRDGSSAFIFDLMEPERPATDRKVLEFVKGHVFDPADFVIRSDGVCRLNPEMFRCVVGLAVRDQKQRRRSICYAPLT
jgi:CRISP-associated protein Cas1